MRFAIRDYTAIIKENLTILRRSSNASARSGGGGARPGSRTRFSAARRRGPTPLPARDADRCGSGAFRDEEGGRCRPRSRGPEGGAASPWPDGHVQRGVGSPANHKGMREPPTPRRPLSLPDLVTPRLKDLGAAPQRAGVPVVPGHGPPHDRPGRGRTFLPVADPICRTGAGTAGRSPDATSATDMRPGGGNAQSAGTRSRSRSRPAGDPTLDLRDCSLTNLFAAASKAGTHPLRRTASRTGGAAGPVRAAGPACLSGPESSRMPGTGAPVQGIRPTHPRLTSTEDPRP